MIQLRWYRRWGLAILHWLQVWVGQQLEQIEGPQHATPKVIAAYQDVAPVLLEVRRHMKNVAAAFPTADGETLRREALKILRQREMKHRRAALAIELVMLEWM